MGERMRGGRLRVVGGVRYVYLFDEEMMKIVMKMRESVFFLLLSFVLQIVDWPDCNTVLSH